MKLARPFQTRFRFGSSPLDLILATYLRSSDRYAISTLPHLDVLQPLVSTGFQVLFHSPPGVLFTFPSQYFSLSVTREYLGLEGGPPIFMLDFSCLALLWILIVYLCFRLQNFHLLWYGSPHRFD